MYLILLEAFMRDTRRQLIIPVLPVDSAFIRERKRVTAYLTHMSWINDNHNRGA